MSITDPPRDSASQQYTAYQNTKPEIDSLVGEQAALVAKSEELNKQQIALERELCAIGIEGATAFLASAPDGRFKTAATLVMSDENDDSGSPYLMPSRILDASGKELWNYHDGGDDGFVDDLTEYTVVCDRDLEQVRTNPNAHRREDPTYAMTVVFTEGARTLDVIDAEYQRLSDAIDKVEAQIIETDAGIEDEDEDDEDEGN
jgi:hypothetical protein